METSPTTGGTTKAATPGTIPSDTWTGTPTTPLTLDNVEDAFTYHAWQPDQTAAGKQVVDALVTAAKVILNVVPPGPDRSVAIRKLRETRMDCNSAITHGGRF
jgi:hypothetical protein